MTLREEENNQEIAMPDQKKEKDVHKQQVKQEEEKKALRKRGRREKSHMGESPKEWIPKTKLGYDVLSGKYASIDDVLKSGELILESEIVDHLIPDIKSEVIYIGGSPGKGGGIRRTATKRTVRMHKSGRRFKLSAVTVVGNNNGIIGIGKASSREHKTALEKSLEQAKLNIIRVRSGCGSWECGCRTTHSIPYKTTATFGSVNVNLIPGPRGLGIVASPEAKKILGLAGIKDVWMKSRGNTHARMNLAYAIYEALRNLNNRKGDL